VCDYRREVWIDIRIYWTLTVVVTIQSTVHCSRHLVFSVCCVYTSPLVTASRGRPSPSSLFLNCPRASATISTFLLRKCVSRHWPSQAHSSFHCASAVTAHPRLFGVCSYSFRTPNDVHAVSYRRRSRLTCPLHTIDPKARRYQWRASTFKPFPLRFQLSL
jgi:hypothetical protein